MVRDDGAEGKLNSFPLLYNNRQHTTTGNSAARKYRDPGERCDDTQGTASLDKVSYRYHGLRLTRADQNPTHGSASKPTPASPTIPPLALFWIPYLDASSARLKLINAAFLAFCPARSLGRAEQVLYIDIEAQRHRDSPLADTDLRLGVEIMTKLFLGVNIIN
jgi:hypothetical protein